MWQLVKRKAANNGHEAMVQMLLLEYNRGLLVLGLKLGLFMQLDRLGSLRRAAVLVWHGDMICKSETYPGGTRKLHEI